MKKNFQVLLVLFVITLCVGTFSVFASKKQYYTIENQDVPGNNGEWGTYAVMIELQDAGGYHMLYDQDISRDIDVRVENDDAKGKWRRAYKDSDYTVVSDLTDSNLIKLGNGWHWLTFSTDLLQFGNTTIHYATWWLDLTPFD